MASFNIELRTGASLHPDGEPSAFISEYTGVITCEDESGRVTKVGRFAAMRVHAALAHDAGESLHDVCDSHSSEMHYLHALLYESGRYHFREDLMSWFDAVDSDLLVLDYVVLSPKWRKLKLGLLATRKLVDLIGGGCGLAVSDIAPLRHEAAGVLRVPARWLPRFKSKEERRATTVRLRRYYRRMGFERLGRTSYYVLPLNQVTPTATELLGGPAEEPDAPRE